MTTIAFAILILGLLMIVGSLFSHNQQSGAGELHGPAARVIGFWLIVFAIALYVTNTWLLPLARPLTGISTAVPTKSIATPPWPTPTATATPDMTPTPTYTITNVKLPPECYSRRNIPADTLPCEKFQYSPDKRYLGFRYGPNICGRAAMIVNAETGDLIYQGAEGTTQEYTYLDNGKIWITHRDCEDSHIWLLDPQTKKTVFLGEKTGEETWNAAHTAIAGLNHNSYYHIDAGLWGYNSEKDFIFASTPDHKNIRDDRPLWTPDDNYLLYQHRLMNYLGDTLIFSESVKIMRIDINTGEQTALAADPAYNYYLCKPETPECNWKNSDWIQVLRLPFAPLAFSEEDYLKGNQEQCVRYGLNCPNPAELFALNWRTGELLPWSTVQP